MTNPKIPRKRVKDPNAHLDFGEDWGTGTTYDIVHEKTGEVLGQVTAAWLADDEVIAASAWFVDPDDDTLTISNTPGPTHEDKTTTVWLDGGTVDVTYTVTNRITTSGGRVDDRSMQLLIEER